MDITVDMIAHRLIELVSMDEDVRDCGDEDVFATWIEEGIPDEAIEQVNMGVLLSLVMDEEEFQNLQDLHASLMDEVK